MTYTEQVEITIGDFTIRTADEIFTESTWRSVFDSGRVRLLRQAKSATVPIFYDRIEVGMPISIRAGWQGFMPPPFEGFVSRRIPGNGYTIEFEDKMWLLKGIMVRRNFRNTTLRQMIRDIIPLDIVSKEDLVIDQSVPDVSFDDYYMPPGTVAECLARFKEKFLICCYFRGNKLFVGLPYYEYTTTGAEEEYLDGRRARYSMQWNVVENKLEFLRKSDFKLQVMAISTLPTGERIKVGPVGDIDEPRAQIKLLKYHGIKEEAELLKLCNEQYRRIRYDGYKGSLISFGHPYLQHSGVAELYDDIHPERSGQYLVEKTIVRWNSTGYWREVFLHRKIGEVPKR